MGLLANNGDRTFQLPKAELAQLSSASAQLVALQYRMKLLDRVEKDLDLVGADTAPLTGCSRTNCS